MLKTKSLTPDMLHVLLNKGTEPSFSGEYTDNDKAGTYLCRQCGLALFRTQNQFHSGCGWASFDQAILNAVAEHADQDGKRMEILCAECHGHLGHVFMGEGFTKKNIRYCVNSLSLDYVEDQEVQVTEEAILAAGCFWGVEYYFKNLAGVIKTEVGYSGGNKSKPSYEEVCRGNTGHYEAIRIIYDPKRIDYKHIIQYFFEIHDPTQADGQGPDRAEQYKSAIFYYNTTQQMIAENIIKHLGSMGYKITTQLIPATIFWRAEEYHQDYYNKTQKQPYCHVYLKRFYD